MVEPKISDDERPTPEMRRDSAQTLRQPNLAEAVTQIPAGPGRTSADASRGPAQPAVPAVARAGTRLGPYEVARLLGRGGMGLVLLAKHTELNREVALKVLSREAAESDPELVERFRRESEATARLDHPGIVRMFERGEHEGWHYYAMELVKGASLDAVIRRERLPYVEAARIVAACAHAIDHAHGLGILHRDLKPANILLETSGRPRITDFGLARMDTKASLTQAGSVVGTPLYMAPEVARGERATRRSDIYSLGATLYELATQKPPYEGRDATTVVLRVIDGPPRSPQEADPRIPPALVAVISRAMARDPEQRYAHARELAVDLERFAAGRRLEMGGSGGAFRETAATKAWRQGAPVVAGLALVVGGTGLFLSMNSRRRTAELEKARIERKLHALEAGGGTPVAPRAGSSEGDDEALHAAQDRDVRARNALKALTDDAPDEPARRSFDETVARARESAHDSPAMAATLFRQALQVLPHRFEARLDLARVLEASDADVAETEMSLILVAPDASPAVQLQARLERARFYRSQGTLLGTRLAVPDYRVVLKDKTLAEPVRAAATADLALALADLSELPAAQKVVEGAPDVAGDDLARLSLARAAIARSANDTTRVEAELARARGAAVSDEVKKLVEGAGR